MSKEEGGQAAGQGNAGADAAKKEADLYENRGTKKVVRLITVLAYLFSVSFVAIVLSSYYLFLWKPPNPRLIRRNRLIADPQIEFLLSDLSTFPNRTEESFDDVMTNESFKKIVTQHLNFNNSEGWIAGRIADDDFDENSIDNHEHRTSRKLNKSLLILKNNLIDLLRGRLHHSTDNENSHAEVPAEKSRETAENENYFPNENHVSFETDSPAVENSNKSLEFNSSPVSANEENKGCFTSAANGTERELVQSVGQAKSNSIESNDVQEKIDQRNQENIDSGSSNETSRNMSTIGRVVFQNYTGVKMHQNSSINSSDKPPKNSNTTTAKTKKLSVYNRSNADITTSAVKEDEVKRIAEDRLRDINISGRDEMEGHSKSSRRSDESSARPINFAMNSGETQMEKLTTKSTIAGSERSQLELETVTTQRQKSLLTILFETTSSDIISSTFSSSGISEDLQTDPSPPIQTLPDSTT